MTRDELIQKLKQVIDQCKNDYEKLHDITDKLVFEYINDKEIYDLCHSFKRECA